MTFGIHQDPCTNVKFGDELANAICDDIRLGLGIVKTCAKHEIDVATFFRWKRENQSFANLVSRAREDQMFLLVDEVLDIADDKSKDDIETKDGVRPNTEWIQRSKCKIDSRKWLATVFAPKDFAPKPNNEGSENTLKIVVENNIDG